MRLLARRAFVLLVLAVSACGPGSSAAPGVHESRTREAAVSERPGLRAVLVAGDDSAAVFDRATAAVRDRLVAAGVAPGDIQRLSASPEVGAREGAGTATLEGVVQAIARLRPRPGQGCLVFATSHGGRGRGLVLTASEEFLTPAALDRALAQGCGDAPTVAIVSGCYSGSFARPPMTRPNRIVLTAAREDRSSFGCGAEFDYTFYDRCLLTALDAGGSWSGAYGRIRGCVAARETELGFEASGPRAFFGRAVAGMGLPGG